MIVTRLRFKVKSHSRGGTEREVWERCLLFHPKYYIFSFYSKYKNRYLAQNKSSRKHCCLLKGPSHAYFVCL